MRPTILVFDSGLGGLTVLSELRKARPDGAFVYAADDAAFPYGAWGEADLVERICGVMDGLVAAHAPDLVVIACGTASTLVLPALRARFDLPFVGTVPAIKPAAAATRSGLVTVLATPGTVRRDYTRDLIATYAGSCEVNLVGSERFAPYAEAELRGTPLSDEAIAAELAPCFVERDGRRTDVVVLGCTHYPLLVERFRRLAPWAATYIDPAPAIARRVAGLLGPGSAFRADPRGAPDGIAVFTGGGTGASADAALSAYGLTRSAVSPAPLGPRIC